MDCITFAKERGFNLNKIPSGITKSLYITSNIIKKSRSKTLLIEYQGDLPFNPVSHYADSESSRLKYASIYNEQEIIDFINIQPTIFDKILSLNPKQVGIVNPYIDNIFDYGNQLHYLTHKFSPIPVFLYEDDDKADDRMPFGEDKIIYFTKENKYAYSYGNLNTNNIIFSGLFYNFIDYRITELTLNVNDNLNIAYNFKNIRSFPYFVSADTGSIEIKIDSPFNFSAENSDFNENIVIDKSTVLWQSNTITLKNNIDYTKNGTDVSPKLANNLSILDEKLKKIYSWKSALVIFENINEIPLSVGEFESKYTFAVLVGLKTVDFKISEKIDSLYYVTIGKNNINNPRFSKKDILFLKSSLKKMISSAKPDEIHFFDLSNYNYGNVCKNGLLFGMESDLQNYVIDLINKNDNQFVKINGKIENLYELFEQI